MGGKCSQDADWIQAVNVVTNRAAIYLLLPAQDHLLIHLKLDQVARVLWRDWANRVFIRWLAVIYCTRTFAMEADGRQGLILSSDNTKLLALKSMYSSRHSENPPVYSNTKKCTYLDATTSLSVQARTGYSKLSHGMTQL